MEGQAKPAVKIRISLTDKALADRAATRTGEVGKRKASSVSDNETSTSEPPAEAAVETAKKPRLVPAVASADKQAVKARPQVEAETPVEKTPELAVAEPSCASPGNFLRIF